ncbi:glycosyltransferase family 9 protein [Geotalea toluenoxydans]|uniref:glycosyltransferase family 9 protein n=1 Tax=Geotalea toluenoxydans TaxID=421624 RepID=UPI001FB297C6|nr:glycosyltransferase family 9 protein [Geotalea toluenoxydans]
MLKLVDRLVGVGVKIWSPRTYVRSFSSPQRILLIRPGGIGDAILLIPTINAIKHAYSDCVIDILAERRNASVFELAQGVRTVYRYDAIADLSTVLCHRYDVVIDTEQWYRLSAVVARLVRAPVKIGFGTNERACQFTHPVSYSLDDHEKESFLSLLHPLDIAIPAVSRPPFLHIPETAVHAVSSLLEGVAQYVALFPGASVREKRWGKDRFVFLAAKLAPQKKVVVIGGREDVSIGDEIAREGGVNLAGRTSLLETAAIIAQADVLVSGDSGVLHLAAGLDVPSVALFGPSSIAKWAPQGSSGSVVSARAACSPCSLYGTIPPCRHNVRCMDDITVDQVISAIESVIAGQDCGNKKTAD